MIKRYVIRGIYIDSFLEKVSGFAGIEVISVVKDSDYEIFNKASNVNHDILNRVIVAKLWGIIW